MENNELAKTLRRGKTKELVYELKVEQAMTKQLITVKPEDTMDHVRSVLRGNRISGTPVTDGGQMIGIISTEDLIRSLLEGKTGETVQERMTPEVVTLYSDEPLVHAVRKFERYGFGRLPVIDRQNGNLVGILAKVDIIRCLLKQLEICYESSEIHAYRPGHWFENLHSDRPVLLLRYVIEGSNFKKAGECSSRLKKCLLELGIHPEIARRITISSYEAEMNIVIFADGGELVVTIDPNKVIVHAVDQGPGIPDVDRALQPGFSTAPDWVRELGFGAGMGLPNIKNNSDEMSIESKVGEGTNVQFTVYTQSCN